MLIENVQMEKTRLKRIALLILIILNCITIFSFSAQKADKSSSTSGKVVDVVMEKIYKNKVTKERESTIRENLTRIVRKGAHFSIYTCLGILTYTYFGTYQLSKGKRFAYTICFCFLYACSDELHQRFVEGRSCEFGDVCIDTSGATFGTLIVMMFLKIAKLIKKD